MPNYGTPINPENAPASKPAVLRSVALGFTTGAEAPQLPAGMASAGSNFLSINGGLTTRPGLVSLSTVSTGIWMRAGWIGESMDSRGGRYPVMLSMYSPHYYSNGSWSALSQTNASSNTFSVDTSTGVASYFDATVYYHPTSDNFELCFTPTPASDHGYKPYTFRPTGNTFSTLTNAPLANYVAAFDSRLVFGHTWANANSPFPQRLEWSARGNPELYTEPDGGAEDLLDARGSITRVMGESDRLVVFFEQEVWQGLKAPFPFDFQFSRVGEPGTMASWSVAPTPYGLMYLGNDYGLYLIPPGGAPRPLGEDIQRLLKDSLTTSNFTLASAVFSDDLGAYLLVYPTTTGSRGLAVRLEDGAAKWSPLGFFGNSSKTWQIRRFGQTYALGTATGAVGPQRILVADNGATIASANAPHSNALEFTSTATSDFGSRITHTFFTLVPNPNPTDRQYVREVRLDYRCASASSLSLRMTPDFGTTYPVSMNVALPAAPLSAQTVIPVGMNAIYPGIELRHDSGHTFTIQGVTAVTESLGNG